MTLLIQELKTRARLLLKLLESENPTAQKRARMLSRKQHWEQPERWQLRHCLNLAAADLGFQHWDQARQYLSGTDGADAGGFWHSDAAGGMTNQWFADHGAAKIQQTEASYLLPFRQQAMLVDTDYLRAMGISSDATIWHAIANDLVLGYGTAEWQTLAQQRLQSNRIERLEKVWDAKQAAMDLQSSEAESQRVLASFVKQQRLIKIPEQRKKRLVILQWLVAQLQPETRYPEAEINQFFLRFHEDYATLRREMIINALMTREDGVYWRI